MATRETAFPNGVRGCPRSGNAEEKSSGFTVVGGTDAGKTFILTATMDVVLPAVAGTVGDVYYFVNKNASTITISPAAADAIAWKNDNTDNKNVYQTSSVTTSMRPGDWIAIGYLGAGGYQVTGVCGEWAKEA